MNVTAELLGVGSTNTLGLVTRRRKPAATIGSTSTVPPERHFSTAPLRHSKAGLWCTWSVREAATRLLMSGVIARGFEHGAVGQRIDAFKQAAAAAINGQRPYMCAPALCAAPHSKLQAFLD